MEGIRYANIGIAVGATIMVVGALVFRDSSEAAVQAAGAVGFFASLATYLFLDERAKRRKRKRQ